MAFTTHWDIEARFISCRFHCLTVVKFPDKWFLAGKLCIVMSVQHNQFYTIKKKTIYFNLHYITTPIKKYIYHLLLRPWSTCKVWFEICYGRVRFLCLSWAPITIIQIWFKKSKMQKDSRLVTITRLKHNLCQSYSLYQTAWFNEKTLINSSVPSNSGRDSTYVAEIQLLMKTKTV